ncbi:MAG: hypothetical protein EBX49_10325 [Synechococcaceae bacterium WB8_1B_136]|nr:hypothetical protein [Synechococcaceae bacterium WB8_1B_136]
MPATPLRGLIAMVLVALALFSGGCSRPTARQAAPAPLAVSAPSGGLQEVAPPGAVGQLAVRLHQREPQVSILSPADNTLLPAGPWTLSLNLKDWPLSDAGDLGLGPHLVVQLDDNAPLRISQPEQLRAIPMAELSPGSHRITVYAARPWGEAVKSPGASRQIRLHRVAANPAQLPAPGSPQLIATSPSSLSSSEPVLIDWLLLDAPLQHLREGDDSWRLRITVNGDSFLVDRQVPLWLKGFRSGSNAVQMELLDGRGDPLNPPFNSLVQEMVIGSSRPAAWQRSSLTPEQLAPLSGEPRAATPEPPAAAATPEPPAAAEPPAPAPAPEPVALSSDQPAALPQIEATPVAAPAAAPETAPLQPDAPLAGSELAEIELAKTELADSEQAEAQEVEAQQVEAQQQPQSAAEAPLAKVPQAAPPPGASVPPAERIAPSTSLSGSARELVNADGSLVKPQRSGPLARLREKLGG